MTLSFVRWGRRYGSALLLSILLAGCAAEQHHRSGQNAIEAGDYGKGVAELSKAAELKPKDVEYRNDWLRARETATARLLAVALDAAANGKDAEAEQAYRTILGYERDNARALAGLDALTAAARMRSEVVQAKQAQKQGDLARAAELAAQVLRRHPGQADAKALLAEIEAQTNAEMPAAASLSGVYKKPINLEFRDASIKMVFDALSRTTGINFIFDRDVKSDQRTTVFLKQTTLDDAIDVILSTGQLEKKVLNASSVLIYPNTPAKLREYQDLMVKAFYLANVDAKQAATMLKTVLKLKDIYVDDKYNMLVLRESPESIALAEKLIALQDLDEPEVMLEVEVLEINRNRLLNLGIQWNSQFTVSPLAVTTTNSGGTNSGGNSSGAATATSTMKLSDLKGINSAQIGITPPSATINLQKSDGDANLLANPRIRVRDREKAKFLIGDKVPVVTTTSTGTFVSENIQYLDVGLKLEVEPDIHLRDEIGLKVALEVSSLVSSVKTNNGSQAYQIGTRNVNTALRLKDGETQIMAGLINDEDRSSANRIPLVGDLPVLGRLFGSQNDSRQKTEIVLSITPHLIRNMQRKQPSAEAFWSGTETTLRNRPLQLRTFDSQAPQPIAGGTQRGAPAAAASAATPSMSAATAPNAPKLSWEGPAELKVGEVTTLYLNLDSAEALRATSLQLAFNPAELEVVSVEAGDYFSKAGKGTFSKTIDGNGGRASVGVGVSNGDGMQGRGRLLAVAVKAKPPVNGANTTNIGVIAMTPIGSTLAVGRPGMPVALSLKVAP